MLLNILEKPPLISNGYVIRTLYTISTGCNRLASGRVALGLGEVASETVNTTYISRCWYILVENRQVASKRWNEEMDVPCGTTCMFVCEYVHVQGSVRMIERTRWHKMLHDGTRPAVPVGPK
jgi:hypothetical protein